MPSNIWAEYADKLAGGWKCISFEVFTGTGADRKLAAKPHGEEPLGRVLLSHNGFLSAQMARPERMGPLKSGKQFQDASDAEVAHVARGLGMYCGYLQLFKDDEGGLYWQTRVECSSDPSIMGGIQERRVEYFEEGGKAYMILRPVNDLVMDDGTPTRGVLKWEKFE